MMLWLETAGKLAAIFALILVVAGTAISILGTVNVLVDLFTRRR